jgi:hypothetical protein
MSFRFEGKSPAAVDDADKGRLKRRVPRIWVVAFLDEDEFDVPAPPLD